MKKKIFSLITLAAVTAGSVSAATCFYDVKDYGAVDDTTRLSTAAIFSLCRQ